MSFILISCSSQLGSIIDILYPNRQSSLLVVCPIKKKKNENEKAVKSSELKIKNKIKKKGEGGGGGNK